MKLNKLFIGAIAALASAAMVACSDDAPDVNNGGENQDGDTSYLTVNLVNPSSTGSRVDDGGYQNGEGAENYVANALFLLFNTDGNQAVAPIEVTDLVWTNTTGGNVEKISNAKLIINGEHGKVYPSRLLCILNATPQMKANLTGKRLSEITGTANPRNTYSVYGTGDNAGHDVDFTTGTISDGSFIMTNAVYNTEGTNPRTITVLDITGKVKESPEDADKDAVDVYVERIVAKVTTSVDENFTNNGTPTQIDGSETETLLKPSIIGVQIANVANTSYLFKNLSLNYDINGTWNAPGLFRSFWETTPTDLTYSNFSFDDSKDIKWNEKQTFYIQPNTGNTKTSVLITAQLQDANGNPFELVKWAGLYYTVNGYQGQIVNQLTGAGYRKFENGEYVNLDVKDVFGTEGTDWNWDEKSADNDFKAYEACLHITTLPYSGTIYMLNGVNPDGSNHFDEVNVAAALTDINTKLASNRYRAQFWQDGYCYYFKEIEHLFGLNGIVRNHIYNLTLSGVAGLGTPIVDVNDPIVPELPDEKETYLAARVNILTWRVVNQNVNFGE